MRARFLTLTACLLVAGALPARAQPLVGPCEANDAGATPASASTIGTPAACIGVLDIGDADLYAFDVGATQTIALRFTVTHGTSATISLLDPAGGDRSAACSAAGACTVTKAVGGKWIAGIAYRTGVGGRYALDLAVASAAPEASCETAGDAPGSSPSARQITPPLACTGALASAGDTDWYAFRVSQGTVIDAVLSRTTTGSFFLYLMGPNGVRSCTQSAANACSVSNAEAGTWYVGIRGLSASATGEYALTVITGEFSDPTPTTCEPQEAGATPATATVLVSPAACTARIRDAGDLDVFAFDLAGAATDVHQIALTVIPLNGTEHEVILTDPAGVSVPCVSERVVVCTVRRSDSAGRWHARIGRGVPGAYALGLVAMNTNPATVPGTVARTVSDALRPTTCEPSDAGLSSERELPWLSPTETVTACRGEVAGDDTADAYVFDVHTDAATVRVVLQPESGADLTLAVTPPPGACAPSSHVDGACPAVRSQLGRAGQPDLVEIAVPAGAKSGNWRIDVGRDNGAGPYTLAVAVTNA